jgi:putative colanic acid biosynthesis UDP-glucose lipid carrier transferase
MRAPRHVIAADLQTWILGGLRLADAAIIVAAAVVSYWLRHDSVRIPDLYAIAILGAVLLAANYMQLARLYVFDRLSRLAPQISRLALSWTAVILSLIALAYFTQTSVAFSRAFVLGWFALSFAGFILVRLALLLQIDRWRRDGRLSLNVAIVGTGESARYLLRQLRLQDDNRFRIVGLFDDSLVSPQGSVDGARVLGNVDELLSHLRAHRVDEIIVALGAASTRIPAVLAKLKTAPVNVRVCPDYVGWPVPAVEFTAMAGLPMLGVLERPLAGWSLALKEAEDRLLALILFITFLPLLALIALAIRIDSAGPVLFRQQRYGFNNNPITVYKFRTMFHQPAPEQGVPQARRNDPRVTRVGAFLRRTSLDELPQLLNVIHGDMSLVGPRPHAVAHNEQYAQVIDDYLGRHRVKPGITGWAQVNGLRGETDTSEKMRRRVQYDLYYIDHWSLLFDLKILLLTPFAAIHRNAY